ncbi:MAG: SRPBCC domain-containing protein [Devosia sp.]
MTDILTRTIALECDVDHAFGVFTSMIDLWWPRGHRKNRDGALRLDPAPGGALIDRAPDGTEWTMGRVTKIDPPNRLDLDWYPGSPAAPTSVEIRFVPAEGGTAVTVTHRPLLETKSIWPQRVALFTEGWESVLPALKSYIEET